MNSEFLLMHSMGQFIEGVDRHQATLLPECLEDYVGDDSPARDGCAHRRARFGWARGPILTSCDRATRYRPGLMLRVYLYGYRNQIQSSRRRERECDRNLKLLWMTGLLKPGFKPIANFRKNNGPAIRLVCQNFVALCCERRHRAQTSGCCTS